jgi:hypothetical protein
MTKKAKPTRGHLSQTAPKLECDDRLSTGTTAPREPEKAPPQDVPMPATMEQAPLTRGNDPSQLIQALETQRKAAAATADAARELAATRENNLIQSPPNAAPSLGGASLNPAAAGAEREAIAKARMIERQARAAWNQEQPTSEKGELHEILDTILGHLGNHSRQLHAQGGELSDIRRQLADLEGSVSSNRYGR